MKRFITEKLIECKKSNSRKPLILISWVNEKDIEKVNYIQHSILESYESDFSKHTDNNE